MFVFTRFAVFAWEGPGLSREPRPESGSTDNEKVRIRGIHAAGLGQRENVDLLIASDNLIKPLALIALELGFGGDFIDRVNPRVIDFPSGFPIGAGGGLVFVHHGETITP
jgi:hypothetical protein